MGAPKFTNDVSVICPRAPAPCKMVEGECAQHLVPCDKFAPAGPCSLATPPFPLEQRRVHGLLHFYKAVRSLLPRRESQVLHAVAKDAESSGHLTALGKSALEYPESVPPAAEAQSQHSVHEEAH